LELVDGLELELRCNSVEFCFAKHRRGFFAADTEKARHRKSDALLFGAG